MPKVGERLGITIRMISIGVVVGVGNWARGEGVHGVN